MINVQGISKNFPVIKTKTNKKKSLSREIDPREQGKVFRAVSDISFTVPKGSIVGLLGANGAGKTTLLRVLSTSLQPTEGTAIIDGIDITQDPLAVRKKIGFLSGKTGLYARLTPRELLEFFARMHGFSPEETDARINRVFDELEIHAYADKQCDLLSTGMRQKVSIARSLVHDPEVIIFDEPTTGLDVAASQTILDVIEQCRQQQKSTIFSTHHMHEVEKLCDEVVIIEQGRVCFTGSVESMRQQSGKTLLDEAYLALAHGQQIPAREVAHAQ